MICLIYFIEAETIFASIAAVPSNDIEFSRETAKSILDTLGEKNVGKLLNSWDNLGVRGCLDVERSLVVSEFTKLRTNLSSFDIERSELEENMLLTAFTQEFERRLGMLANHSDISRTSE